MASNLALLKGSSFFQRLEDEAVRTVARLSRTASFRDGHVFASRGRVAEALHLITAGQVDLVQGPLDRREIVRALKPGEVVGRSAIANLSEVSNAVAVGPVTTLSWNRAVIRKIFRAHPSLEARLLTRASLEFRRRELVDFLKKTPLSRETSPVLIRWLLDVSTLDFFSAGQTVFREGENGLDFYIIVKGEVKIVKGGKTLTLLYPGNCFGEMALLKGGCRIATAMAQKDAEILAIDRSEFNALCRQSAPFRRGVYGLSQERHTLNVTETKRADILWFLSRPAVPLKNIKNIVFCLGQYFFEHFREKSLILEFSSKPVRRCSLAGVEHRVRSLRDRSPLPNRGSYNYVFCISDTDGEDSIRELMAKDLAGVVVISPDGSAEFPYDIPGCPIVHHVSTTQKGEVRQRNVVRLVIDDSIQEHSCSMKNLSEPCRNSVGRLARTLSRRLVGVALGGGGAWGYAHHALLRGLHRVGVPVDIVSGVSFGSLVGAFYASDGLIGLDRLENLGWLLPLVTGLCPVSSWPIEWLVGKNLSKHFLEELEIPFLPVAVNIQTGEEEVFRRGPISEAVRASGAFPGIFGPVLKDGRRFVDGGILNNVPASIVSEAGADFIIASNVIPAPRKIRALARNGILGSLFSQIWPLARVNDSVRSIYLLLKAIGERQASNADVTFSPELSRYLPSDFGMAREIVRSAERQLNLDDLKTRYRTYCLGGDR